MPWLDLFRKSKRRYVKPVVVKNLPKIFGRNADE
jgi:hypothetical protein